MILISILDVTMNNYIDNVILDQITWYPVFIFMVIAMAISVILFIVAYILGFDSKIDIEKSSSYECGFNPFSETRYRFDVKFYLVSILFVIFDVEILYFFPFSINILNLPKESFAIYVVFYLILMVGIVYEVSRGILDFEN